MAVISISIEESKDQIISGIPKFIEIQTSVPSTIFYTLDGREPNEYSSIYTSKIYLPTDKLSVTLSVFATNGIDNSSIFSKTYFTNLTTGNLRLPHSSVDGPRIPKNSLFPFGTNSPQPNTVFKTNAGSGITIDSALIDGYKTGYDGYGNPIGETDSPNPDISYEFIYSKTDKIGNSAFGVGNMVSYTTIIGKSTPEEYNQQISSRSDKLFNPRAMVVFQDSSLEDPSDPAQINRQYFSLQNKEIVRDGSILYNNGPENNIITGSFVRNHYNPRTQEMTYYYYDNSVNRWIISKMPYQPSNNNSGELYSMVFSRPSNSSGFVFKWVPFARRVLI